MTVYGGVNLAWQMGHDHDLIRRFAEGRDVLAFIEARDKANRPVDVGHHLGPDFDTYQDLSSGERAGSAIAVRKGSGAHVEQSHLREVSPAGHDVQARFARLSFIRTPDGPVNLIAWHNPLSSTGVQGKAMATAEQIIDHRDDARQKSLPGKGPERKWLAYADVNMDPAAAARQLGAAHHIGRHPVALFWSEGWGDVKATAEQMKGTDHAVLTLRDGPSGKPKHPKR